MFKELIEIQSELKAPKGQYNSFGKYKYRSCEDILEAVKPLLKKQGCGLILSDELVMIGDRYYVKATATITNAEGNSCSNSAWAREEETKKGQDGSQITGTSSSYARKYALNGLFLIDDTKDADTDEHHNEVESKPAKAEPKKLKPGEASADDKKKFMDACKKIGADHMTVLGQAGLTKGAVCTVEILDKANLILKEMGEGK